MFISTLAILNIPFKWSDNKNWNKGNYYEHIEDRVKAIHWKSTKGNRVLAFNLTIPSVRNNIDICLFKANDKTFDNKKIAKSCEDNAIMFGELKGGIDPAGADEHWKTSKTALRRIRKSFSAIGRSDIKTAFVGAAIEDRMAQKYI